MGKERLPYYIYPVTHEYAEGWSVINGKDYYFNQDGVLIKKSCVIDGIRYKINSKGVCVDTYTGWAKNSDGVSMYWDDGDLCTGWTLVGENWYYIDETKGRLTGKQTIDGCEYKFSKKGVWDGTVNGKLNNTSGKWTKIYNKLNKKKYGGVYIKYNMIVVWSVDGKAEKAVKKLLKDTGGIVFREADYSVYEMNAIKDEIFSQKGNWTSMYVDDFTNRLIVGATKMQYKRLEKYLDTLDDRGCVVIRDATGEIFYDD